jgi:hypothetical protein
MWPFAVKSLDIHAVTEPLTADCWLYRILKYCNCLSARNYAFCLLTLPKGLGESRNKRSLFAHSSFSQRRCWGCRHAGMWRHINCKWFPTFRSIALSSGAAWPLRIKAVGPSEPQGTIHPVTQRHIPEYASLRILFPWRFHSSGIWHNVDFYRGTSVSEVLSTSIFRVNHRISHRCENLISHELLFLCTIFKGWSL